MSWFDTVFGATQHLSTGQQCARAALIFIYGLVLVRLAGRRVFGKWAALDIIVSIVIGSNLSRALTGNAPLVGTLLATAVLMLLHWLFAQAASRSQLISRLVEGAPVEVARDGELDHGARKRWAVSEADVHEALRQTGVETIEQTERLVLEPSGKISVLKRGR
jgi:uncharacterized membrane protein YcaP (DUF421 family)